MRSCAASDARVSTQIREAREAVVGNAIAEWPPIMRLRRKVRLVLNGGQTLVQRQIGMNRDPLARVT